MVLSLINISKKVFTIYKIFFAILKHILKNGWLFVDEKFFDNFIF